MSGHNSTHLERTASSPRETVRSLLQWKYSILFIEEVMQLWLTFKLNETTSAAATRLLSIFSDNGTLGNGIAKHSFAPGSRTKFKKLNPVFQIWIIIATEFLHYFMNHFGLEIIIFRSWNYYISTTMLPPKQNKLLWADKRSKGILRIIYLLMTYLWLKGILWAIYFLTV